MPTTIPQAGVVSLPTAVASVAPMPRQPPPPAPRAAAADETVSAAPPRAIAMALPPRLGRTVDVAVDPPILALETRRHLDGAPPPAVQQIVTAIVDSVAPGEAASAAAAQTSEPVTARGPVDVLHLVLHPQVLGEVAITLRLRDGGLAITLAARQDATARLVDADKGALADALRAAGVAVETLVVRTASGLGGEPAPDQKETVHDDRAPPRDRRAPREPRR